MMNVLLKIGRAKSNLPTTEAGIEIDSVGVDYAKCDEIPVTKMIPVRVLHGRTFSNEGVNDNRGSIRVGNNFA